jgi:hypothetical protein
VCRGDYVVTVHSTEEQDVDILTKALSRGKFEFHRCRIGVVDNPFLAERENMCLIYFSLN